MDDEILSKDPLPENVVHLLLAVSNSCSLDKALECLIEIAKTPDGRSKLAEKNVLSAVLQLCQCFPFPACHRFILLSLKLVRNLCAGEISNQNLFLEENGVGIILSSAASVRGSSSSDCEIIRMGLQLLGNVSLAGKDHQRAIWHKFFPLEFHEIAKIQIRETCDPLCMVVYTCCEGTHNFLGELCSDQGIDIVISIIRTASAADLKEEWWLKQLLSRICLEGSHFAFIFSKFYTFGAAENSDNFMPRAGNFVTEQASLLRILCEILNEQEEDIIVSTDFILSVQKILTSAISGIDIPRGFMTSLPTGVAALDILGYSLTVLRDICARDCLLDAVDALVSNGLVTLLLGMLRDLEPPTMIKKATGQGNSEEGTTSRTSKSCPCPYKGFRRDIVSVLGNCAYKRKHVQDEIREQNGIFLLLQQCVTDEDNPFLREWGIWAVRNLMEGNAENQKMVADLEVQGSVDIPEIADLGLRVEVDPNTRRAKLVNA